ncbi:MAG: dTDP-4-dehydrorhamnose reductase [Provencibacterium sp.]|nr:dTDP-4-dehydrorhamnose reductase [Provencibacterium sp.]
MIVVTGSHGQLGHDVLRCLMQRGQDCIGVDRDELDITDGKAVAAYLDALRPQAVIHCAAYTAVDKAEEEPEVCRAVNAQGTRAIAAACRRIGAKLLYLSTDYVFSGEGETPYETGSPTGPLDVYGQTKLEGEQAVLECLERYFIVRISWVFGLSGQNFVKTMLRLGREREELRVVADQVGSPTYTADLAPLLCEMVETNRYGVYHATNEGFCSWAQFAEEIFRQAGLPTKVQPIPTAEYPAKAARPLNSRLSRKSLDAAGFSRLPHWKDALRRYLDELEGAGQR